KNAELPAVMIGYHAPRALDADRAPLDVVERLLSGGESARLHQDLVRRHEVATAVDANNSWGIDPDLFWIYAQARPKRTAAAPRGRVVKTLALLLVLAGLAHGDDELRLPRVTRAIFDNGLHVVVAEYHELPLVEFQLIVGAGAAQDPPGKEGVSAVTANALRRGAGKLTAEELARAIESLGGRI